MHLIFDVIYRRETPEHRQRNSGLQFLTQFRSRPGKRFSFENGAIWFTGLNWTSLCNILFGGTQFPDAGRLFPRLARLMRGMGKTLN